MSMKTSGNSSWQKLDQLALKLESLSHAMSMLGADEACHMPPGGGEKRAQAMATLASMSHELQTSPQVAEWLHTAENEMKFSSLQDETWKRAALREWKALYLNHTCLPVEFVQKKSRAIFSVNSSGAGSGAKMTGRVSCPPFPT